NPGNNLHVSGLSHKVDSNELEVIFAKVGRVKKASVMYDPHSRESRGFGFVTMETAEEADAAITALNSTELMGKIVTVEKVRTQSICQLRQITNMFAYRCFLSGPTWPR
ncbi:RNA-binding domain-containing protein, partial [Macrolepiota fuliginosa MF-IS2]